MRIRNRLFVLLLAAAGILPISCSKDDDSACDAEARTVAQAGQLYASLQTTQNCLLYKRAIQDYLNSACSNNLSSTDRVQLQNIFNNLPC
jgi:uncharacterized protein YaaR (DUF327 family)